MTLEILTNRINKQISENKKLIQRFRNDKKQTKDTEHLKQLKGAIYVCQFANRCLKNLLK
jgi:hypothetical protein